MARLPNSDRLVLELRKIEGYCLNPAHPRGRHKARVFREALGLNQADAQWLRTTLLEAARDVGAIELEGARWDGGGGSTSRSHDTSVTPW